MLKNVQRSLAVLSLAAVVLWSGAASALPYSSLVVFGDSLADSGNNALLFDQIAGGARTPTPLTEPLIPTFPYVSNTYSNGPVWTEYLAAKLGLSLQPSLAGGANYAFGGARTGSASAGQVPGLSDQVNMFLAGGTVPNTALYVVEGGGNDARDVLTAVLANSDPTALIQAYAHNMAAAIDKLALNGADQFLLWNVPDIGLIPAINGLPFGIPGLASQLTAQMNLALLQALALLAPDVTDGIHLFDAYGAIQGIVANPGAYGFTNASDACAMDPACINDPNHSFFWDGIHPTTAGHALMANLALAELPEPATCLLTLVAGFGLLLSRRRAPLDSQRGLAPTCGTMT